MSTLRASVCKKLGLSATAPQADIYRAALSRLAPKAFSTHLIPKKHNPRVGDVVEDIGGGLVRVRAVQGTYEVPGHGQVVEVEGVLTCPKLAAFGEWSSAARSPENDKKAQREYAAAKRKIDDLIREHDGARRTWQRAQDAAPGTYSARDMARAEADYEKARSKRVAVEAIIEEIESYGRQRSNY